MYLQNLIEKYSQKTGRSAEEVGKALSELRDHALTRLTQNRKFQETGIANLHVSFVGDSNSTQKNKEVVYIRSKRKVEQVVMMS